jgi:hypothetical protein
MKSSLKKVLVALLIMIVSSVGFAQRLGIDSPNYRTAIGLRGGELGGITLKHFTRRDYAVEAIFGVGYSDPRLFVFTLLFEKQVPAFNVSGMRWYYGGGGHVTVAGSRSGYYRHPWAFRRHYYDGGVFGLGVDGVLGLEYKIPPIPFAISFDFKPYIEVVSKGNVYASFDPALGIKLTF